VTDTDLIAVHGTPSSAFDTYVINQSQGALAPGKALESDGVSEIETTIDTGGAPMQLHVAGTSGPDTMRVSAAGGVMLGSDADVDVRARSATKISLDGGPGNDFLSGRGGFPASFPGAATTKVTMFGGDGDDTGVDGPLSGDELQGNGGNDTLFSQDFQSFDHNFGGEGFDRATMDSGDFHSFNDIESITFAGVGRLKLAPAVVTGDAGKPARLKLAWKHPKAWKQLRSLKLTANDAGKAVGSIRIDPARANISAHGALEAARGSTVEHHGKSVIVQLRLRPSKQLAGRTLRLAVQATDVHGKRQIEPLAGSLTVNH
jgi:hypothetical protein